MSDDPPAFDPTANKALMREYDARTCLICRRRSPPFGFDPASDAWRDAVGLWRGGGSDHGGPGSAVAAGQRLRLEIGHGAVVASRSDSEVRRVLRFQAAGEVPKRCRRHRWP